MSSPSPPDIQIDFINMQITLVDLINMWIVLICKLITVQTAWRKRRQTVWAVINLHIKIIHILIRSIKVIWIVVKWIFISISRWGEVINPAPSLFSVTSLPSANPHAIYSHSCKKIKHWYAWNWVRKKIVGSVLYPSWVRSLTGLLLVMRLIGYFKTVVKNTKENDGIKV
jgi:hypothetical protein